MARKMIKPDLHSMFEDRLRLRVCASNADTPDEAILRELVAELNGRKAIGALSEWILGAMLERFKRERATRRVYGYELEAGLSAPAPAPVRMTAGGRQTPAEMPRVEDASWQDRPMSVSRPVAQGPQSPSRPAQVEEPYPVERNRWEAEEAEEAVPMTEELFNGFRGAM